MVQRLESERSAGNQSFSRGEWSKAVAAYTRALTIDPTHTRFNALLFCNRAAAHSKHGQLQQVSRRSRRMEGWTSWSGGWRLTPGVGEERGEGEARFSAGGKEDAEDAERRVGGT